MRLLLAALWVLLPISAWATCPANPSDCPSPTFHNMTVNGAITATGSTLSGGTQTGANVSGNNVTATGGSAARTEAAWQADRSNVLAQSGADPSGSTSADNSVQINAAAALTNAAGNNKSVYLPSGTYHIKHAITLTKGQCLIGDSRGTSVITVGADFDSAAASVIALSGGNLDPGPCVTNIGISFTQPTTDVTTTTTASSAAGINTITVASTANLSAYNPGGSVVDATTSGAIPALTTITNIVGNVITLSNNLTGGGVGNGDIIRFNTSRSLFKTLAAGCTTGVGGTGCSYPPAIAPTTNSSRAQLSHIRIANAWTGISTAGHNFVYWLDDVEMSAFNSGLSLGEGVGGGVKDVIQISHYDFWNYNNQSGTNLFSEVFFDGNTNCMSLGEIDGLNATGVKCLIGKLNFTTNAASGWYEFTNLQMDSDGAAVVIPVAIPWLQITNFYCTMGTRFTTPCLSMSGEALVQINNWYSSFSAGATSTIVASAGELMINGGHAKLLNAGSSWLTASGTAFARLNAMYVHTAIDTAWTIPVIQQTGGTGAILIGGLKVGGGASTGTALSYAGDNLNNTVNSLVLRGGNWTAVGPTGTFPTGMLGDYNVPTQARRTISSGSADTELATDRYIVWNSNSGAAKAQAIFGCPTGTATQQTLVIQDKFGDSQTNPITVTPSGGTIMGAATYVIASNGAIATLSCNGNGDWSVRR